jgi:hypothetical protein
MVLVVADEPRGTKRFGSQVAGPTAEKILSEALGLTAGGESPTQQRASGFGVSALAQTNDSMRPWQLASKETEQWTGEGEEYPW